MTEPLQDDAFWSAQLVAVATNRDRIAFAALFRHFAPRVKAFLMRTGLSEAAAEDCMQDAVNYVLISRKH